ncbi:MAG: SpaA isopeptide-forming pilin-related protein, partial [Eubacteriales bacterium]|nr:SpaA isopeptide-forming pilin-related protein [Eubacteriales bacterium]
MRKVQNLFRKGTMKKACKKVVATAMAAAMVVGMVTPPTVQAANDITYEVSTESSNITNLMSQFGFIGFNSVTTQGHQHMNMATKSLNGGGGEYCIRQTYTNGTSTNYIQNLPAGDIKIGYSRDTLVVGEEHAVTSNGSENFIDGRKVESAGTVKADTATHKYMNLENLQQNFQAYVNQLASLPSSVTMENKRGNSTDVTVDFSDQNAQKIYVNASSGTNVVNLTPQDFANPGTGFNVEFAKTNTSAILVINIDMQGATVFDCKQVRTKVAGIDYDTGEAVWDKNTNRVYLNFYDSTKPNGIYSGEVKFTDESTGTIIAPYANVTVGSNWCGMLVGNNVRADGESHRTNPYNPVPAIGKTPDDEKPKNKTGEITFKGTKTVEGTGAPSEVYTFIVNELGVGDVATGTVTGAGNIQFQTIKYGKNDLGDHVYKITEYKGDTPGMKYDTSSKRVTVSVKDPGAGTEGLLIQITGDSDVITFNNVYTPVKKTVKISKQAVGGGAELAGAKLTVKNSAGAVVESWTSGASKKEISLADGIYTLTETTAPDGYEIAESITFKVEKGVVSVKSGSTYTKVTDDTVVMLDAKKGKTKVKISKQAVGGGSELVGAKLVVKNSSGTQVASWTSGTSKKEIELAEGTYTLTETTAPDGYEVAETMTFKIEKGVVYVKDGSSFKQVTDSTVVMYDNFGKKKVKISKQAVGGGSELAGAKLVVKNSSGTQVASWT